MEAIAALGLASSILQVIDFSVSLLSATNEIRENGSTTRNTELSKIATDLLNMNHAMIRSCETAPATSWAAAQEDQTHARFYLHPAYSRVSKTQDLKNLASQCSRIATELVGVLSNLQVTKHSKRWDSARTAIMTVWKKPEIDKKYALLESIRGELVLRVVVTVTAKVDVLAVNDDKLSSSLAEARRDIIGALLTEKQGLQAALSSQITKMLHRQDATDALIQRLFQQSHLAWSAQTAIPRLAKVHGQILDFLLFRTMEDRYEDIPEAHKKTFEWMFGDQGRMSDQSHSVDTGFMSWLHDGHGIYWVSGKAGSGKSTLMKYLGSHPRTKQAIKTWAAGRPYLFASFYFWNAGMDTQKNQVGLFRSLLHQCLEAFPGLSPLLFPRQHSPTATWDDFPTFHELRRAFKLLTTKDDIPIKIFLHIDGLDEYEGAHGEMPELAEIFTSAASSPNVKVILSSRPLQEFEDAFVSCPKLRLHDLTFRDISMYTRDKLGRHPRMIQLTLEDPLSTKSLMDEVVNSASGVFLWVTLVLRSLLEGLQSYDEISDLESRLREMPRDLEDLFQHMLDKINPRHRAQSSQFFQLVRLHEGEVADLGVPLTALFLSFADSDLGISRVAFGPLTSDERAARIRKIEVRLRTRCLGLVELRSPRSTGSYNGLDDPEVGLLHKSVADFLDKPKVREAIVAHTQGTSFNTDVRLLRSSILALKCSPAYEETDRRIWNLVEYAAVMAQRAKQSSGRAQEELLHELDNTMKDHVRLWGKSPSPRLRNVSKEHWLAWRGDYLAPELVHLLKSKGAKATDNHHQIQDSGLACAKSNASSTLSYQGLGQIMLSSELLFLPLLIANELASHYSPSSDFSGVRAWFNPITGLMFALAVSSGYAYVHYLPGSRGGFAFTRPDRSGS